jgi:hypothetical protein
VTHSRDPAPSKERRPRAALLGVAAVLAVVMMLACSGDFDRSTGHYRDNTVVHATLVARR